MNDATTISGSLRAVALALLIALPCGACRDDGAARPPAHEPVVQVPSDAWTVELAAELGEKLGGVCLGDLDPDAPGDEIAVVGSSGRVWSVAWRDGAWTHTLLAELPGEAIGVVAGELDGRPGDELVAVGMASGSEDQPGEGAVRLLTRGTTSDPASGAASATPETGALATGTPATGTGTDAPATGAAGWSVRELYRSPALVHGVCLADLDGEPGDEILAAGYARQLVSIAREPHPGAATDASADDSGTPGWSARVLVELPAPAKNLVPWRQGVALALTDGEVVLAMEAEGRWFASTMDSTEAGRARLASDGERLLVAGDDGALVLLGSAGRRELHRSSDKLRGAALANLVPTASGLEAATVGYDGRLVVLTGLDGELVEQVLLEDGERLHHLASGTIAARGPGVFLVTVGYSGRVFVARGPGW